MKDRITLLRPVATETDYSVNEPVYEPVCTVWANVRHKSGTLGVSSDMLVNVPRVIFTIRNHVRLDYGMMIEFKAVRYVIIDIDDTTDRDFLIVTTEAKV